MQRIVSKRIAGGLVLVAAMTLSGLVGFARQESNPGQNAKERAGRPHERMRGGYGIPFARNLNLTEAQKEQMRQIAERYHENFKALHQQAASSEGPRSEPQSFKDGPFDEATVRAAAQTRANARVEMEVARARMMHEMYNVLTPEQKAQMAAERQQREERRQERRGRRNNPNPSQNL